ncbi:Nucleolar pre-ribosomal-associated protein 1 [Halotydeus destructor]|nr:Nucleolar pre-ribosomal-associated protein 1 [Halotydeus destructor]
MILDSSEPPIKTKPNKGVRLLTSYNATLATGDQDILRKLVRRDGKHSLLEMRNISWGPKVEENAGEQSVTGIKHQKLEDVLRMFHWDMMKRSISQFPLHIDLDFEGDVEELPVYDPRFVLPLLYHQLAPQNLINCYHFVELRGLSYTLVALSSFSLQVRALAYAILSRFYQHLEASTFYKDRQMWLTFLDALRCGMKAENEQLHRITSSFLTDILDVLLAPGSLMHEAVRGYLSGIEEFSADGIMKFLMRLQQNSNAITGAQYAEWSLMCLVKGSQTELDYHLCKKHQLFTNLMSFSLSTLPEYSTKIAILKLLESTLKLEIAAKELSLERGLTSWLLQEVTDAQALDKTDEINEILKRTVIYICKNYIIPSRKTLKKLDISERFVFYPTFVDEMLHITSILEK